MKRKYYEWLNGKKKGRSVLFHSVGKIMARLWFSCPCPCHGAGASLGPGLVSVETETETIIEI